MASLAAILAIGKPVALDARALDRDTRGFISMTTSRPVRGWTANWMVEPAGAAAGRLGGPGAGPGPPGVHLDDDEPAGAGVDGELDVAPAGVDADGPQH